MNTPDIINDAEDAQVEAILTEHIIQPVMAYYSFPLRILMEKFNQENHGFKVLEMKFGVLDWDVEHDEIKK